MEKIEFFVGSDGNVWLRNEQDCRKLSQKDYNIIELVLDKIVKLFPAAYNRLKILFKDFSFNKWIMNYKIVDRFIRCNMGADNLQKFDIEDGFLNLEEVTCPLHGICQDENIICRPNCRNIISKAEMEVVRLYAFGYNVDEIAKKLGKNKNTVNNQIWQVTRRLGLKHRRQLIKLAIDNKIV